LEAALKMGEVIHANVTKVSNNGIIAVVFSEELFPIANLSEFNLNISNNIQVDYKCKGFYS
jgi:hypothetical protein